jgi:hypothetical protein
MARGGMACVENESGDTPRGRTVAIGGSAEFITDKQRRADSFLTKIILKVYRLRMTAPLKNSDGPFAARKTTLN